MTLKGRVKKEVDGHWHPVYGRLKAGAVVDVETGEDGSYPDQIFELVEEKKAGEGKRKESTEKKGGE